MRTGVAFFLGFCLTAGAQEAFWLDGRDGMAGPFAFRPGAPVRIGTNTYSLVTSVPQQVFDCLESIIIPEIDLDKATIREAVRMLNDAIAKATPEKRVDPLSVVLSHPANAGGKTNEFRDGIHGPPSITFMAVHISVLEALKIICNVCDLKYRVEGRRIVVMPLEVPDVRMVERIYDVGTNFPSLLLKSGVCLAGLVDPFATAGETAGMTSPPPWRVYYDMSEALIAGSPSWTKYQTARFSPSSGLLTVTVAENYLDPTEKVLGSICGKVVTNAVQEVTRPPRE